MNGDDRNEAAANMPVNVGCTELSEIYELAYEIVCTRIHYELLPCMRRPARWHPRHIRRRPPKVTCTSAFFLHGLEAFLGEIEVKWVDMVARLFTVIPAAVAR